MQKRFGLERLIQNPVTTGVRSASVPLLWLQRPLLWGREMQGRQIQCGESPFFEKPILSFEKRVGNAARYCVREYFMRIKKKKSPAACAP